MCKTSNFLEDNVHIYECIFDYIIYVFFFVFCLFVILNSSVMKIVVIIILLSHQLSMISGLYKYALPPCWLIANLHDMACQ